MPGFWCFQCTQPRSQCPPGREKGGCAVTDAISDEYREELANSPKRVFLGSVPGGTTKTAGQMDHTRKFDNDMHRYREARRAGEQPDQISVEGIERAQRRRESHERALRDKVEMNG